MQKTFYISIFIGVVGFSFLTAGSVFAIDAPNLISPEQNATRSPGDITFEWSSVPTGDWKSYTSYNLYITPLDPQRTEIKERTNNAKKTVQFTAPGRWYWLVEACENIGRSPFSYQTGCTGSQPLRSLTISSSIAQPTSIGPGITQTEEDTGAIVEAVKVTNPTLTWQWNGDTTILKNFNIYINGNLGSEVNIPITIGKNDPKLIKNGNQYSYTIDPGILKQGEPYSWYVVALSITNDRSQPSETRLFKVEVITSTLPPPILDSSLNKPISLATPVLYWVPQSGINCYEAEVKVKDGQKVWSDKTNKSSIVVPTTAKLTEGQTYTWRARASRQECSIAANWSDWSEPATFTVNIAAVEKRAGTAGSPGSVTQQQKDRRELNVAWPKNPLGKDMPIDDLPKLIEYIYGWGISLAGFAAFIVLVIAGFQYLTSAGNSGKMQESMDRIKSAGLGIILLFGSVLVLNTINPRLTQLKIPPAPGTETPLKIATSTVQNIFEECKGANFYALQNYVPPAIKSLSGPGEFSPSSSIGSIKIRDGLCQIKLCRTSTCQEDDIPAAISIYSDTPDVAALGAGTQFRLIKVIDASKSLAK